VDEVDDRARGRHSGRVCGHAYHFGPVNDTVVSLEGFSGEPRIEITDSGRVEAARIELKFWADNKQGHEAQLSRCGDNPEKKAEIQGNIAKAEAKIAAALAILDEERSA
jgi:hypothetical protein